MRVLIINMFPGLDTGLGSEWTGGREGVRKEREKEGGRKEGRN